MSRYVVSYEADGQQIMLAVTSDLSKDELETQMLLELSSIGVWSCEVTPIDG